VLKSGPSIDESIGLKNVQGLSVGLMDYLSLSMILFLVILDGSKLLDLMYIDCEIGAIDIETIGVCWLPFWLSWEKHQMYQQQSCWSDCP